MRVGYIGLGDIGTPIAERILHSGEPLVLWNRTRAKMDPFLAAGASAAASPSDLAARADIIITCLDSDLALEEVLLGQEGVVTATERPRAVVDHSTIHPARAVEIGMELANSGVAFVDAPVSGGAPGAQRGTLAIYLGGAADDVAFVRPIVQHYGGQISHVGPLGAGQVVKACNQLVTFCSVIAIGEALALAEAVGLEAQRLPEFLQGGYADSNMLQEYARGAATGEKAHMTGLINSFVSLFHGKLNDLQQGTLALLLKDLGIVSDLARKSGSSAPMISLAENLYRLIQGQQSRLI